MKNMIRWCRLDDVEEWIRDLEARIVEITEAEQKKAKRIKINKDSLKDLWGKIQHTNIHIIGVLEGEEREKEAENIFKDIISEKFLNLGKVTNIQVWEEQRDTNKINPKRTTSRHTVIKMAKIKNKERGTSLVVQCLRILMPM